MLVLGEAVLSYHYGEYSANDSAHVSANLDVVLSSIRCSKRCSSHVAMVAVLECGYGLLKHPPYTFNKSGLK